MIARRTTRSPLLWMALALGLATLFQAHLASPAKSTARWTAIPPVPRPLSLEAGHDARLVRASFGTHPPALRSTLFAQGCRRVALCGNSPETHRINLIDFDPLHRRPPPSFS
jgi:hypothetical protein